MEKAKEIIHRLHDSGFEVYIVGGYVRDYYRGKYNPDVDLATNATPEELKNLFSQAKVVGTDFFVTMIDDVEVATYRKDRYELMATYVVPAKTIYEDLARRDLTINAMALNPITEELIDPHNGIGDLKNGIIRFVGNPHQRIKEDTTRILRACRFMAVIDGRFDEDSFYAMIYAVENLPHRITPERIRLEILKAMNADRPSKFFTALRNINLLREYLPEIDEMVGLDGGKFHDETVWEHSMVAGDMLISTPVQRLAGYLHDIGKPTAYKLNCDGSFTGHEKFGINIAKFRLNALKFSTEETNYICDCIKFHMYELPATKIGVRRFLNKIENKRQSAQFDYADFLDIRDADNKANMINTAKDLEIYDEQTVQFYCMVQEIIDEKQAFTVKDLAVNGDDIIRLLNIKPSQQIRVILNTLLDKVIEEPEMNIKEILEREVMKWQVTQ